MSNRTPLKPRPGAASTLRRFLHSESAGGLILMTVSVLALVCANSPAAPLYFDALHFELGPLSVQHWINDALMTVFFLLVALEIKRETSDGQLATWDRRVMPGIAAAGGILVPAVVYLAINLTNAELWRGWAIPSATDIAFALAVITLLGDRVPASLKVFIAALAIIDDLGAVIVIAVFYTEGLDIPYLASAVGLACALFALNRFGVRRLLPYLAIGILLWICVLKSGIHATIAGVVLALMIPLRRPTSGAREKVPPLQKLEHALHKPVAFLIVPVFGFANAGVSFAEVSSDFWRDSVTLGIALGLLAGKVLGVFGAALVMVKTGLARLPRGATWAHMFGVSLLCGIGFTMSLFIAALAFSDPQVQERAKIGILLGSLVAGCAGYVTLRLCRRKARPALKPR